MLKLLSEHYTKRLDKETESEEKGVFRMRIENLK